MFYKIQNGLKNLKWKAQHFHKGYSDKDVYSIRDWFLYTMPKMLKEMEQNLHGHPADMTDEQWKIILDKMAFCFKEAHDDTCSQINEYEDLFDINYSRNFNGSYTPIISDEDIYEKWKVRQEQISEYQNKMLHEGLDLFQKYFWDLWD